jgi:DNA-binding PadR family transcriptional regulator
VLRYGVLGLLIERRGYGYELVQRLARRLGAAWQLNPSAVYGALDQLEAQGLIEPVAAAAKASGGAEPVRPLSRRGERIVYEATERGVAEFERWLARPSERLEPIRSELALKLALGSAERAPTLLAAIEHEERLIFACMQEECEAAAGRSAEKRSPALRLVGEQRTAAELAAAGASSLVAVEMTLRLQAELDWLSIARETLAHVQDRERRRHGAVPRRATVERAPPGVA